MIQNAKEERKKQKIKRVKRKKLVPKRKRLQERLRASDGHYERADLRDDGRATASHRRPASRRRQREDRGQGRGEYGAGLRGDGGDDDAAGQPRGPGQLLGHRGVLRRGERPSDRRHWVPRQGPTGETPARVSPTWSHLCTDKTQEGSHYGAEVHRACRKPGTYLISFAVIIYFANADCKGWLAFCSSYNCAYNVNK